MSTGKENWYDSSLEGNTGRDGNQYNGNYGRSSYNRERGERPHRPRFNPNAENKVHYNNGGERSYRPRFNSNAENGERQQRSYSSALFFFPTLSHIIDK